MEKPIPELSEEQPAMRLIEFYNKLGWDRKATVDTSKVVMTKEDWELLVENEIKYANECEIGSGTEIGLLWMDRGPRGDGNTPGKVKLLPGWLS